MLRRTILAFAALALCFNAPATHAGGINLSWDDCGAFGVAQKTFACDTNAGSETLYLSAIPNVPMPQLNGQATLIDLETNQATLSNWWHFESGGCHSGSPPLMPVNFDFTSGPSHCVDVWNGLASGGLSYLPGGFGPNTAKIRTVCALAGSTSVNATSEFYLARITISHAKTVGACSGCSDGACLVFQQVLLTQPATLVADQTIYNPILRQYVTWQSGGSGFTDIFGRGCPAATPTRKATWGSIKSMYR